VYIDQTKRNAIAEQKRVNTPSVLGGSSPPEKLSTLKKKLVQTEKSTKVREF